MDHSVCYVSEPQLLEECCKIPNIPKRARIVDSLVRACKLFDHMDVLSVKPSSYEDLAEFHSSAYIDFLQKLNDTDASALETDELEFGIGYDCPPLPNIWKFVTYMAGASLTAARALTTMKYKFAINWCGGWHHAMRESGQGFCYVNDIVLAIELLRKTFGRVLYIDLDVHHGNGVEYAYMSTDRVLTLSFHQFEPGFFPTTGALEDVGEGKGRYFSVNVPLHEGITDSSYYGLFNKVTNEVIRSYNPRCVVVQCGTDCLAGDPLGGFNLTPRSMGACVKKILKWEKPTLFLGGGGYHEANAARCWTYLTAIIAGQENTLMVDIPDNEYFSEYGPDFTLDVVPGNRRDYNTLGHINVVYNTVYFNMKNVKEQVDLQEK